MFSRSPTGVEGGTVSDGMYPRVRKRVNVGWVRNVNISRVDGVFCLNL